jgi:hypothetical protein
MNRDQWIMVFFATASAVAALVISKYLAHRDRDRREQEDLTRTVERRTFERRMHESLFKPVKFDRRDEP